MILGTGFEFKLRRDGAVVVAPSQKAAKEVACKFSDILEAWAIRFDNLFLYYPGCKKPYHFPAPLSEGEPMQGIADPNLPIVEVYQLSYSPALARELNWFLEHPEQPGGIVAARTGQQIALSRANTPYVQGPGEAIAVKQAVSWKREEFWFLPDLEAFLEEAKQKLEANNPASTMEFSWRSYDPLTGPESEEPGNWLVFTNRYRLVHDEVTEEAYHVSHNLGFEPCAKPVGV